MKKILPILLLSFFAIFVATMPVSKAKSADMPYFQKLNGKNVQYYVMNPDPIFGATAVLIEKNGKGLLVDTQFSQADAEKILRLAKEKKIEIQKIYVSYSDPDYYFGTSLIQKAFPKAKVFATEKTIQRIQDTYQKKLLVWSELLGENAPEEIIIPTAIAKELSFEGESFQITGKDPAKTVLFNANDQIILGGILISTDSHLFMADTKTIQKQNEWIDSLNDLQKLEATVVIPGHFSLGNHFTPENIHFTKQYIIDFIVAERASTTSAEIIQKMTEKYPDLAEGSLEMSAKVVTSEEPWD